MHTCRHLPLGVWLADSGRRVRFFAVCVDLVAVMPKVQPPDARRTKKDLPYLLPIRE